MAIKVSLVPCLWFDDQAEAAAKHYTSIFKNSSIGAVSHFTKAGHDQHKQPAGRVMTVEFTLEGTKFTALNGGPQFKFSEAISFQVMCETQDEIDYYWRKLSDGGSEGPCGWLKDRFGLSWQVVPVEMAKLMNDTIDKAGSERATEAMMKMGKLDIAKLKAAHAGK